MEPSQLTERKAKDSWSPTLVAALTACALALVLLPQAAPLILLPLIGILLLVVTFVLAWSCYDLVRRRFRHALSIIAAVAMAATIVLWAPMVIQSKDVIAFYMRLPHFERQVERARARQPTQEPLQIVLDYQDRSLFVTANLFYFVIYDETDGAGPYKAKYWPYSESPTGVTAVDVPPTMKRLTGHYYDFSVSY